MLLSNREYDFCGLVKIGGGYLHATSRRNFEFEGYDVISADNGGTGLERDLTDDPDLVVLDVMMPRMSGLDVFLTQEITLGLL